MTGPNNKNIDIEEPIRGVFNIIFAFFVIHCFHKDNYNMQQKVPFQYSFKPTDE